MRPACTLTASPTYQRHRPERTVLYSIISGHYPRLVREIERSGGHAGRKALTLYSVPPLEQEQGIPPLARLYGFSLHAGTVCEAHQRSKLERLCR